MAGTLTIGRLFRWERLCPQSGNDLYSPVIRDGDHEFTLERADSLKCVDDPVFMLDSPTIKTPERTPVKAAPVSMTQSWALW